MDTTTYIENTKSSVLHHLHSFFLSVYPQISPVSPWGNDAVKRLYQFMEQGKMLRSTLLTLSDELFSTVPHKYVSIIAGASIELIQAGLLIHDDIMDGDVLRRGNNTMHIQYKNLLERESAANPSSTGESFAICTADIAYFLSYQLLSKIPDARLHQTLQALYSTEFMKVCAAQIQDVYGGSTIKPFTKEVVQSIYAYKTGRYTCALPLVAGAIIANANEKTIQHLWRLGTALGIAFQLKDDELNLFGDEQITGKSVGSDIREGKQTMYKVLLMEKASDPDREKFEAIYGNRDITPSDIEVIRQAIRTYKVDQEIKRLIHDEETTIQEIVEHLPLKSLAKGRLNDMMRFILQRKK